MAYPDQEYMDKLIELAREQRFDELRKGLQALDPADLADFMEELPGDERDRVFEMLDVETASEVIVELEPGFVEDVVEAMTSDEIADLADQMAPDDAADFLADMEEGQRASVLAAMEETEEVSRLLPYAEDTAGHVMTPEVYSMPASAKVEQAQHQLSVADLADPVFNVYVVDDGGVLVGILPVSRLLSLDAHARLGDVADGEFVSCRVTDDQEEVARLFRKYDLWVVPVVDETGRLIGRITVDDIMDVVHEEANEDLAHMVGAPDIEEDEDSPLRIVRLRLPWLLITMFAGLLNSMVISSMLAAMNNVVAIAVFVPAILAMGGNTGMQSSTIAIRGIALGRKRYSRLLGIVGREVLVGVCLGVCCGLLAGSTVCMILHGTVADTGGIPLHRIGIAVGVAMCSAMAFASCFGSVFPILLHRVGVDPAVASGPFVTTSNDLSSAVIYFLSCLMLLRP